jgi:hypothetical protein
MTPTSDRGDVILGAPGAVLVGAWLALSFFLRNEGFLVSVIGSIAVFAAGASWVLLHGRLRRWLIMESGLSKHLQIAVFAASFLGFPLVLIVLVQNLTTR